MAKHGVEIDFDDETGEACLMFEFSLNDDLKQATPEGDDEDDLDLDTSDA